MKQKKDIIFQDMFGNNVKVVNGNFSAVGKTFEIPPTIEHGLQHYSTKNITIKEYYTDLKRKEKAYSI